MTTIKFIVLDNVKYELPRSIDIDVEAIKRDADLVPILIAEWKKDYKEVKEMSEDGIQRSFT